jgi:hypothetical protein
MGRVRYLVIVGAALALAACGEDDGSDLTEVTKALERDVQEQTGTGDVRVVCPEEVSEGDVCEVRAPGGLQAQVRITRLDGDDVDGEIVQP